MSNWERKSSYLLREIVKFRTYIDSLNLAKRLGEEEMAKKKAEMMLGEGSLEGAAEGEGDRDGEGEGEESLDGCSPGPEPDVGGVEKDGSDGDGEIGRKSSDKDKMPAKGDAEGESEAELEAEVEAEDEGRNERLG